MITVSQKSESTNWLHLFHEHSLLSSFTWFLLFVLVFPKLDCKQIEEGMMSYFNSFTAFIQYLLSPLWTR